MPHVVIRRIIFYWIQSRAIAPSKGLYKQIWELFCTSTRPFTLFLLLYKICLASQNIGKTLTAEGVYSSDRCLCCASLTLRETATEGSCLTKVLDSLAFSASHTVVLVGSASNLVVWNFFEKKPEIPGNSQSVSIAMSLTLQPWDIVALVLMDIRLPFCVSRALGRSRKN